MLKQHRTSDYELVPFGYIVSLLFRWVRSIQEVGCARQSRFPGAVPCHIVWQRPLCALGNFYRELCHYVFLHAPPSGNDMDKVLHCRGKLVLHILLASDIASFHSGSDTGNRSILGDYRRNMPVP